MSVFNLVNTQSLTNDETMLAFYKDCQPVEIGDVVLITPTPTGIERVYLAQVTSIDDVDIEEHLPTELSNIHYLRDIITQPSEVLMLIKYDGIK